MSSPTESETKLIDEIVCKGMIQPFRGLPLFLYVPQLAEFHSDFLLIQNLNCFALRWYFCLQSNRKDCLINFVASVWPMLIRSQLF